MAYWLFILVSLPRTSSRFRRAEAVTAINLSLEPRIYSGLGSSFKPHISSALKVSQHMEMKMPNKITVQDVSISIREHQKKDFISLTDIARFKDKDRSDYILQNWMRNRETIEFLGLWERINNDDFNSIEFDGIKNKSGVNSFILTPKQWISKTNASGIISKAGRYGGTYAHKDIAFEFGMWISAEFKIYLIKEFQRLKDVELGQLGWDIKRNLTKINYLIHTDAIKKIQATEKKT